MLKIKVTWGRMRNKSTWEYYAPGTEPALFVAGRGFTGHEHLPWFNVINMNGRVYDPLIGQFLSPDNFVQSPDFTQNFNRYAYCLNNPLVYTDPDGEFHWLAAGIVAIFTYFKTAHDNRYIETGKWAWNPIDWFKKGNNTNIQIGVSTNSEFSNFTTYVGVGSGNLIPAVAYNTEHGFGYGNAGNPGFNEFNYPSIDYSAPEKNAIRNINSIKRDWNGQFYIGDAEKGIYWMKYYSRMADNEFLVYETTQGLYFDTFSGYSHDWGEYKMNYKDAEGGYHAYSYVHWDQNKIVLSQCLIVSRATVKFVIHPHPYGSEVGPADFYFGTYHNVPVIAVGLYVYSGLIDPSFRVIDPSWGGNNPEGRSFLSMQ